MSFVFRGNRGDIETGLPGFIPERRFQQRLHAARQINTNTMAFLVTVLVLFMILNSHQMSPSPNFMLWLVLGVFLMASSLRMYAAFRQLQAQAHANAVAARGLLGHTELRLHVPPSISLTTRGRLHSLRLQLALLDREFDDLDFDALRTLDSDDSPDSPSMTEDDINALPLHKYKVHLKQRSSSSHQNDGSSLQQASTSSASLIEKMEDSGESAENTNTSEEVTCTKKKEIGDADVNMNTSEEDLTCTVCLEQVNMGDLLRSLPCLHQFHANCIDPWLRQKGTCPVCKHRVRSGWHINGEGNDASYMV